MDLDLLVALRRVIEAADNHATLGANSYAIGCYVLILLSRCETGGALPTLLRWQDSEFTRVQAVASRLGQPPLHLTAPAPAPSRPPHQHQYQYQQQQQPQQQQQRSRPPSAQGGGGGAAPSARRPPTLIPGSDILAPIRGRFCDGCGLHGWIRAHKCPRCSSRPQAQWIAAHRAVSADGLSPPLTPPTNFPQPSIL